MKRRVLPLLTLALLCALGIRADQLEVRARAQVYAQPSRYSERIAAINPADREGPYLVQLLSDSRTNGYYKIRLPGTRTNGWIYKTYVRRLRGPHPSFRPYARSLYTHWIDEDGDCQNTRAEVLVRDDDDGKVEFTDERGCSVASGTWHDPYTGETFQDARQLDIDHLVPLKNAHESGAWAWSRERRRAFANSLAFSRHLLAVKASENRRKGDKGPDRYLPPLKSFHCEYVQAWVKIKQDWELEMTEAEGSAVEEILRQCH